MTLPTSLLARPHRGAAALETLIGSEWPRIHRIISAEMGDRWKQRTSPKRPSPVLPRLASFESIGSLRAYLSSGPKPVAGPLAPDAGLWTRTPNG